MHTQDCTTAAVALDCIDDDLDKRNQPHARLAHERKGSDLRFLISHSARYTHLLGAPRRAGLLCWVDSCDSTLRLLFRWCLELDL